MSTIYRFNCNKVQLNRSIVLIELKYRFISLLHLIKPFLLRIYVMT